MQIGISTYTYGWAIGAPGNRSLQLLDELALLHRARNLGVGLVQFGDNWLLRELSDNDLKTLDQQAVQQQISPEVGVCGLTDEWVDLYINLTRRLRSHLLRFVIDTTTYEPYIDGVIGVLKNAVPTLKEADVTLGPENHDWLLARQFADIVERVGSSQVGICLDSVNSMGTGEGLREVVDTLAPCTVNLPLKDFGIKRLPHLMGFQIDGRPAGQGMLSIPWLVEQVSWYDHCQSTVLEQWVVPESTLAASIDKEAIWAEKNITYLKNSGLFTT